MHTLTIKFDSDVDPQMVIEQFKKTKRLFSYQFRIEKVPHKQINAGNFFKIETYDLADIYIAGMVAYRIEQLQEDG